MAARKWMVYIDQYIIFPGEVKMRMKKCPADTLFVFTDQSLGPWIPLAANSNHIIHCHDFLAQYSALGKIKENPVSWTGKLYQGFIRKGFRKGKNFISVSNKTRNDLHEFIGHQPRQSQVVYNGLNPAFSPAKTTTARALLGNKIGLDLTTGYILHVGSDQWYKNRIGVVEIYDALRNKGECNIPLLMTGDLAGDNLAKRKVMSPFCADIHMIGSVDVEYLRLCYSGASVFLFPSLAEGFGWPIAEAMACGCPVVTTNEAPMTEVAGDAGFFIARRPHSNKDAEVWASEVAEIVRKILNFSIEQRSEVTKRGIENAERFDSKNTLDLIEEMYKAVVYPA